MHMHTHSHKRLLYMHAHKCTQMHTPTQTSHAQTFNHMYTLTHKHIRACMHTQGALWSACKTAVKFSFQLRLEEWSLLFTLVLPWLSELKMLHQGWFTCARSKHASGATDKLPVLTESARTHAKAWESERAQEIKMRCRWLCQKQTDKRSQDLIKITFHGDPTVLSVIQPVHLNACTG